jgi:hypothetical protein
MQGETNHNMTDFTCCGNQPKRVFETSHINTNEMQLFFSILFGVTTLHVSDAVCVHHQEYYKL